MHLDGTDGSCGCIVYPFMNSFMPSCSVPVQCVVNFIILYRSAYNICVLVHLNTHLSLCLVYQ